MNASETISARSGFEWALGSHVPCRGPLEAQLDELKERLLGGFLKEVADQELIRDLRRAATEAAALAWYTACPILVLPILLEEKVLAALKRWEMQERVRRAWRLSTGPAARTPAISTSALAA